MDAVPDESIVSDSRLVSDCGGGRSDCLGPPCPPLSGAGSPGNSGIFRRKAELRRGIDRRNCAELGYRAAATAATTVCTEPSTCSDSSTCAGTNFYTGSNACSLRRRAATDPS